MLKSFRQLIVFWLFFPIISFSQTVSSVIVSGWGGQHDEDVITSFLMGYSGYDGTEFPGSIELYSFNIITSFQHADSNNIDLIIRSQSDLIIGLYYAPSYPQIKLVMPSGSNEFIQSYNGDVINSPVIITGAGIDSNVTGYQIEFFSADPMDTLNLSSFANGYIAGQIAYVANTLDISIDSARVLARTSGSHAGDYDYYSGFGKILIENIIDAQLPVELSSFTAELSGNYIELRWITQTEINNYGFEVQRKLIFDEEEKSTWETLTFIDGEGNSNHPNYYNYKDKNSINGERVFYRLKQIDLDGSFEYSSEVTVDLNPAKFKLFQNYPNPFNPATNITFGLDKPGQIVLKIFSVTGEEVQTVLNEEMSPGVHTIKFDAGDLTSGIYIYKLDLISESGSASSIKKMNLIK